MQTLYKRFKSVAEQRSHHRALVVGENEFTFSVLLEDVKSTAKMLISEGVAPGDCVAVVFPNGYEFVVAILASFAVGARVAPLNPAFPEEELQYYLDSCAAKAVFFQKGLVAAESYSRSEEICSLNTIAQNRADDSDDELFSLSSKSLLHMFSSGSTGKSKRITRTQHDVLREFDMMASTIGLTQDEVILCTIPLYHAHGFANALMSSLLSGSTLVILAQEFNGRATVNALAEYAVTIYPAVPFMYQVMAMVRFKEAPKLDACRLLISAGAPLTEKISQDFYERYGLHICQLYGSSETGAISVNLAANADNFMQVGFPMDGIAIDVRDEGGDLMRQGEEGEVWIKSPAMTTQYDNLPSATEECFVDGWLFLGDLGVMSDVGLKITGRKKLMINVVGNKVDPLEIEQLLSMHTGVSEVVVVGKAHELYGEQIKAYIVPANDTPPDTNELLDYSKARLVEYKVPKEFEFIDEIPRSPLGKILRKYL